MSHRQTPLQTQRRCFAAMLSGIVLLAVAPVASAAPVLTLSNVADTSFGASWTAVSGASGYELQVATDTSFTATGSGGEGNVTLLTETFDYATGSSLLTLQNGWTGTNIYANDEFGIRVGVSGAQGWVATPALTGASGTLEVVYSAKYWSASDNSKILVALSTDGGMTYGPAQELQLTADITVYTNTFEGATAGAIIRWMASTAQRERFLLDNVTISGGGSGGGGAGSVVTNVTTAAGTLTAGVTGLTAATTYYARVRETGGAEWSAVESVTTLTQAPSVPAWAEGAWTNVTVAVGGELSLNVAEQVTGFPAPVVTKTSGDGTFDGTTLVFSPYTTGVSAFVFLAANSVGSASVTVAVTAVAAAVTVPTLTLDNATLSTFDASWTACTGVTEYELQVATDSDFTVASSGTGSNVTFASTPDGSLNAGWSYVNGATNAGSYHRLTASGSPGVVSAAFSTEGATAVTAAFSVATYGGSTANTVKLAYSLDDGGTWMVFATNTAATSSTYVVDQTAELPAAALGMPSVRIQWLNEAATSGTGVRLRALTITGVQSSTSASLILNTNVSATAHTVTGLAQETVYYARVRGTGEWSAVKSISTASPEAVSPAFAAWGEQYAMAGEAFSFDVAPYVAAGYPEPVLALVGGAASFSNGVLSFTPALAARYEFIFTASNASGVATQTLVVAVSPAGTTVLDEDFAGFASAPVGADCSAALDSYTHTTGWTGTQIYADGETAKFGSASASGVLVTPALDLSGFRVELSFRVRDYTNALSSDATTLAVSVSTDGGSTYTALTNRTLGTSWEVLSLTLDAGAADTRFRFAGGTAPDRFYLDDVRIQTTGASPNQPPVISLLPTTTTPALTAGQTYTLTVSAAESDGDAVTLAATGVPSGAVWSGDTMGTGLRTGTLTWTPAAAGTASTVFTATDKDGTASVTVVFTVSSEPPGTLAFAASTATVAEDAGSVTLTVTRNGGAGGAVTVAYATAAGSASPGSDFTATSGTLSFAAGEIVKSFSVPILNNTTPENAETFTVTLSNATGGASIGSPATLTVTLTDDDDPNADYYADCYNADGSLKTGNALKEALCVIINTGVTTYSYSSLNSYMDIYDACPTNSSQVLGLYLQYGISSYNKEHIWANSHGIDDRTPAYSDMHHLRATDTDMNSLRGNLDFDNCRGLSGAKEKNGCYYISGTAWEPPDSAKGDVARAMFYMDVRYDGIHNANNDLELVDTIPTTTTGNTLGKLSTLLEWNELDPVDSFETNRNEIIHTRYQKNRNPFIDHPEWVRAVFDPDHFVTTWTLTAVAGANGTVSPSSFTGVTDGSSKTFGITPYAYYRIDSVLRNGVPVSPALFSNTTYFAYTWDNITADGTLSVTFAPLLAAHGTPQWWLAQYDYTSDFDAAELDDLDDDGIPNWREYANGTDPMMTDLGVPAPWVATTNAESFTAEWTVISGAAGYQLRVMTTNTVAAAALTPLWTEAFTEIGSSSLASGFVSGWTVSNAYGATNEMRIGSSGGAGWVASPAVAADGGTLTVVYTAASWNGDDTTLYFGAQENGTSQTQVLTETRTVYTNTLENLSGSVTLCWSNAAKSKRFFLDDVTVYSGGTAAIPEYVPGYSNCAVPATVCSVTGLTAQTPYTFQVRATAASATGAWSDALAVTTLDQSKADQSIIFAQPDAQVVAVPLTLFASASSGLSVSFALVSGPATLDGNTLTFTGAGTVTVTASQSGNANWNAAEDVTRSFVVTKAAATVTLDGLAQTYDGTAKPVTVTTVPADLPVTVTYNGEETAPIDAGSYAVAAMVDTAFYSGTASGMLVIAKVSQTLTFAQPDEQVVTVPLTLVASASSGLPVSFTLVSGPATLDGNTLTFTGAGTVTVTASQSGNANWNAAEDVTRSFVVTKAAATVTLDGLAQTYDGTAKTVTVTTVPADLPVTVTYNGEETAPIDAGSYAVAAMVDTAFYSGTASGTLVIAKVSQTLTFDQPDEQVVTVPLTLLASASSGLSVSFTLVSGPATLEGNTLTFTGSGTVTVTASQPGNANWNAAEDVTRSFVVTESAAEQTAYETWLETQGLTDVDYPEDADSDDDGVLNRDEYLADTDPSNPGACFEVIPEAGSDGRMVLRVSASTNRWYQQMYATNLMERPVATAAVRGTAGLAFTNDVGEVWFGFVKVMLTEPAAE